MSQTTNRTFICSVVFLDIVSYSELPVDEQIKLKNQFNIILAEAIKDVAVNDRIILDTGDGAAISFLGDPEDALFVALSIRDAIVAEACTSAPCLSARIGINLGPVKLVQDINGQRNLIGDGINVAQRVMSFADPGQVLVSRSYFEVISRLSQEYAKLFHYEGSRADKHVREHQVYSVYAQEKEKAPPPDPLVQQMEEQSKEVAGGDVSPSAARAGTGAQRSKTVTAGDGQPFRAPQRQAWQFDWKKLVDSWSVKGHDLIKTLSSWSPKRFNWNEIRNNRPVLYGAAAVVVILISVPIIVWTTGGVPVKDATTTPSSTSIATAEPTTKAESPSPASTPTTLSFGIAPWGEVYVDGQKKGIAPPLNVVDVEPGKHLVEIRNTAFPPYKQAVELKPGEELKIRHKFRQ
jgi:hypothetical protein